MKWQMMSIDEKNKLALVRKQQEKYPSTPDFHLSLPPGQDIYIFLYFFKDIF
jgi:hypothetical protein